MMEREDYDHDYDYGYEDGDYHHYQREVERGVEREGHEEFWDGMSVLSVCLSICLSHGSVLVPGWREWEVEEVMKEEALGESDT